MCAGMVPSGSGLSVVGPDVNAMVDPSGDQTGLASEPGFGVIFSGVPPAAATMYTSARSSRAIVVGNAANAMRWLSADQLGSPRTVNRSSCTISFASWIVVDGEAGAGTSITHTCD